MSLQSPEYWSARAEERGPVPNTCGLKVDKARCGPLLICMILWRKHLSGSRIGLACRQGWADEMP